MEIIALQEVDSTNIYAKNNIEKFKDKTVIHALRQTQGRGRLTRKWVDLGDGNLFLTFVLKPSDKFTDVYSNLTQYLSVKLCEIFETFGLKPEIKWPNDVLINGKKIAGILSESVVQGSVFKGLVLGVGVNLNACQEDLDNIPDKLATSLNLELNKNVDINEFISILVEKFFADYEEFLKLGFEFIKRDYVARTSFLDTEIKVQVLNETKFGIAKSITGSGELVITQNDKEFILTIGDILC